MQLGITVVVHDTFIESLKWWDGYECDGLRVSVLYDEATMQWRFLVLPLSVAEDVLVQGAVGQACVEEAEKRQELAASKHAERLAVQHLVKWAEGVKTYHFNGYDSEARGRSGNSLVVMGYDGERAKFRGDHAEVLSAVLKVVHGR